MRVVRSAGSTFAAAGAAVAAAAAFVGWKAVGGASLTAPDLVDMIGLYYPLMDYAFDGPAGTLRLWNPYQASGEPLFANPSLGFAYPLYLTFPFLETALALQLDVVIHLALATFAMWALCRAQGIAWGASLLGGVVYAYCGSMLIKISYPPFLAGVAWLPLIVLLVQRVIERAQTRDAGWLAVVIAFTLLGGNLQFTYFTLWVLLPFVAAIGVEQVRRGRARHLVRPAALLGMAVGLGVCASLIRVLPNAEFMQHSWRPPGTLDLPSSATMAIPPAYFAAFSLTPIGRPTALTHAAGEAYTGILPTGLALAGLLAWKRRLVAIGLLASGVTAVLYAFGTHGAVFPLLFALPGGSWFRAPDRALIIFGFAVAWLCAAGLDPLLVRAGTTRARLVAPACVALLAGVAVLIGNRAELPAALGTAAVGLVLLAILAARIGPPHLATGAAAALGLLILVDLARAQQHLQLVPSDLRAALSSNEDFIERVRARQGLDRTYIASDLGPGPLYFFAVAGAGLLNQLWLPTNYAGGVAGRRLEEYLRLLGPPLPYPVGYLPPRLTTANLPALNLLGVRFLLIEEAREAEAMTAGVRAGLRAIHRARGLVLYENRQALPRAFLVPRVEVVPDGTERLARLLQIDLRDTAVLDEPLREPLPPLDDLSPDARAPGVDVLAYEPERIVLATSYAAPGLLVLTDQYHPGWRVAVDGAVAEVVRVNHLFRGVRVPAGRHRVEFRYQQPGLQAGAAASAVAWIALALILGRAAIRRRTSHGPGGRHGG